MSRVLVDGSKQIELVRCKDCTRWDRSTRYEVQLPSAKLLRKCTISGRWVKPNYYCGYWERVMADKKKRCEREKADVHYDRVNLEECIYEIGNIVQRRAHDISKIATDKTNGIFDPGIVITAHISTDGIPNIEITINDHLIERIILSTDFTDRLPF